MKVAFDKDGKLWIAAENETEAVALTRLIENRVEIFQTCSMAMLDQGGTHIVLSCDRSNPKYSNEGIPT